MRKSLQSRLLTDCYAHHASSAKRTFLPSRVTQRVTQNPSGILLALKPMTADANSGARQFAVASLLPRQTHDHHRTRSLPSSVRYPENFSQTPHSVARVLP